MASFKDIKFKLIPGERVEGRNGHNVYQGVIEESRKRPGRAAVFSRYGFVGCYVACDDGKSRVLNELKPITGNFWDRCQRTFEVLEALDPETAEGGNNHDQT